MPNGTISWDMIYHPRLIKTYTYFHHASFFISSFMMLFAIYIILKKSSTQMKHYKHVLAIQLIWVYLLEFLYYLWRPINLLPFLLAYADGPLKILPPEWFFYILYGFGFIFFACIHSMAIAFLFRVSQVFLNTLFWRLFNDINYFRRFFIVSLIVFEIGYTSEDFCHKAHVNPKSKKS